MFSWSRSPRKATELAQKAISMNDQLSDAHALLGYVYTFTRQYDKAIAECERAVDIGPNDELACGALGMALSYGGR